MTPRIRDISCIKIYEKKIEVLWLETYDLNAVIEILGREIISNAA